MKRLLLVLLSRTFIGSLYAETNTTAMLRLLEEVRIPELRFKEVSLNQALDIVAKEFEKASPGHPNVKFSLSTSTNCPCPELAKPSNLPERVRDEIAKAEAKLNRRREPDGPAAATSTNRMTLSLRNVPVIEA